MLHHREPAVVGLIEVLGLVLFNVGEGDFLELVLFGVDRGAHKGRRATEERGRGAGGGRIKVVARDLEVDEGRNGLLGQVLDVVVDLDGVAAAMQGEGFDEPHATRLGRKLDREGIAGKLKRVAGQREGRQV